MLPEDPIPTFLSLQQKKRRKPTPPLPQLAFDLAPPAKPYQPIVLTPEPPEPPPKPTLYTVRQLIAELRGHIEHRYTGSLNVEGEISNYRPAASGHVYFTLKDGDAQLPVVLFRAKAQLLPFRPKDGLAVEVRGRISVYESRGQLQLIAETLKPRGEGALELAFQLLKRKLKAEGLFDRPKQPLPPFPHCIGIITSPHGAAIRDIIHVIRRRHSRLNLLIFPAPMQGPGCAPAVLRGIRWFNQIHQQSQLDQAQIRVPQVSTLRPGLGATQPPVHPGIPCVDLILITRGGGSLEDLAGFNNELLARAIAASILPVVSAIGHEIDHTIADYVADLRAPTPSAAAELITAAQHRIEERVLALAARVLRAGEFHLLRKRQRLARLAADQILARLRDAILLRQQRIDDLRARLTTAFTTREHRRLRTRQARLTTLDQRLQRQSPQLRLALAQRRLAAANLALPRLAQLITTRRHTRLLQSTRTLETLSPLAVLSRGYAIVYLQGEGSNTEGTILLSPTEAPPDTQIRARLAHGTLSARVTRSE